MPDLSGALPWTALGRTVPPSLRARADEGLSETLRPLLADTVAKVENRTTQKISQKPMFRRFYGCNAR
jgi:hypothetical protein